MTAMRNVFLPIDSILTNLGQTNPRRKFALPENYRGAKFAFGPNQVGPNAAKLIEFQPVLSANGCPLCGGLARSADRALGAATNLDAVHPNGPANHGGFADDDRAVGSCAAGANDAAGAYHRIGFGGLQ